MGKIKIDIIVPVYNVEAYLEPCLDSLLLQTEPVRIIIINDGSPDNSKKIAKQYAKDNDNILYIEQKNAGLSAARNKGLEYVTSEFVAFMDSDDYVSPDYYQSLLKVLEQENADFVCSDITYTYTDRTEIKPSNTISGGGTVIEKSDRKYPRYMVDIFPMAQNKLWRSSFLKEHNFKFLEGKLYEDLSFFYEVYPYAKKIAFTTEGTFYYRQRKGSIVKTANIKNLDIIDVFKDIIHTYKKADVFTAYQAEIEYLLIRNCLVASAKRLAYSGSYSFIRKNLDILYQFVEKEVVDWRKNKYIRTVTVRHVYLKTFYSWTLPLHSILLVIISQFIKEKKEY